MAAASSTSDDPGGVKTEEQKRTAGETGQAAIAEPGHAVTTREKHDAPQAAPEPDEFGLPVKPPRRRKYSLEELENPEKAKPEELPEGEREKVMEESGKGSETDTKKNAATDNRSRDDSNSKTSQDRPPSHHEPQKPSVGATSEWSHMQLAPHAAESEKDTQQEQWQDMPALAEHRIYDDWGKVLAKSYDEVGQDDYAYGGLGGAGKGYTRVQVDDDAQSATSMDDHTAYLFKDGVANNTLVDEDDEEARDLVGQMSATKNLLTESQKIAYVGVVRLAINEILSFVEGIERTKGTKKQVDFAAEGTKMWGQKMMVRLYQHMDVSEQEQVMVEQLAEHGLRADDLTPALMANARVKNPQNAASSRASINEETMSSSEARPSTSRGKAEDSGPGTPNPSAPGTPGIPNTPGIDTPPPAYEEQTAEDLRAQDADELKGKDIDLDIRWTVLCDLFLLLIADSVYDARSRTLLEKVGSALSVDWQEICRFEKRVTDALEMQQAAEKENWNEDDHLKSREKRARNKRMMVMGLCTVGGGLVIGLSAGMLAPVIGGGLAAAFSGIGIAGTSGFLGGTGAAALIGTTGTVIGGSIGLKGAGRRTGAVKTFEYRPLYNNKRVNLIVTVAGWMTGNVDDVRLPFSTVDPIMGDIYSVNWEPEMLQTMGQTVQILGTEALTQAIQHALGATFLSALLAGLSLPLILSKLSYLVDNPWAVSLARADATGLILADSLIDRNLGVRPITLVGFSLGSRVIFSCLRELARRGALGLVQNVYMFGSPVVVKKDEWIRARTVVSGRFVNAYATNDWILAYLFRATSGGILRVAGLNAVDLPGIENHNVTEHVPGHLSYRGMMPFLLHEIGWSVESVEFTEIEDPDPENHEKRQRELIKEIEEARKEAEAKPEKKGLKGFFARRRKAGKKEWETYDERSQQQQQHQQKVLQGEDMNEAERLAAEQGDVMFDVEAIRREAMALAVQGGNLDEIKQHLSVREIESTLPALKIESPKGSGPGSVVGSSRASTPGLQRSATYNGSGNASGAGEGVDGNVPAATSSSPSTPAKGEKSHAAYHNAHDAHNDADADITLSFEASEQHSQHHAHANGEDGANTRFSAEDSNANWNHLLERQQRPKLTSANTSPAPAAAQGRNPWAEDDEEAFGREKEVSMSFE